MMDKHTSLIHTFYTAFQKTDPERMVQCYHDEIRFQDPVFGVLHGEEAKNMWRMLVRPGIKITYTDVVANENTGSAKWVAEYAFGKSQRPVINQIHAHFAFRDGKIIQHTDKFDLWKWSRQALGLPGALFGWTSWMQNKLKDSVRSRLAAFQRTRSENQKNPS